MTSKLIAAALLAPALCLADPYPAQLVANMQAQSEWVMSQGLCAVANDTKDYGSQMKTVVLPKVGVRRLPVNAYNQFRNVGYAPDATGQFKFAMTKQIGTACLADAESQACIVARSMWNASWGQK